MVLFVRARAFKPVIPGPIELTVLEPTSLAAMVGVKVLITGRISRLGTVALYGLGAATVVADGSDYLWSYLHTPLLAGSPTIDIIATDATNGSTDTVSVTLNVAAAAVYPATVTPLARFDGAHAAMFSDTAGTVPAPVHGPVLRANDVSPLSSNWQGPHETRDPSGIRLEPSSIFETFPLNYQGNVGTAINLNDSTIVCSWIQRWQDWALILAGVPEWVISAVSFKANNGNYYTLPPAFITTQGARHSMVFRYTPTAIKAELWTNGVQTATTTVTMSIAGGHPNAPNLVVGQSQSYAYGTLVDLSVVNRAVSDSEAGQLIAHADSIPCRSAFPLDQPLYAAAGDSNTVGVGTTQYNTYKFSVMRALRATRNLEVCCVARGGWGVVGHSGFIAPFYDARRKVHIVSCLAGTNDFSADNPPAPVVANYFAELDAMRAQGWRVIAGTVQDRNGLWGSTGNHTLYRTAVDYFNAAVRAGSAHYDALVDLAAIPQLGADGAADNTTYFSVDKVHFTDAGQQLIHAPMMAAVEACYAMAA